MSFSKNALVIFQRSVDQYHVTDNVTEPIHNPYAGGSIEAILYKKKLD